MQIAVLGGFSILAGGLGPLRFTLGAIITTSDWRFLRVTQLSIFCKVKMSQAATVTPLLDLLTQFESFREFLIEARVFEGSLFPKMAHRHARSHFFVRIEFQGPLS
jgi:hypothetical protein